MICSLTLASNAVMAAAADAAGAMEEAAMLMRIKVRKKQRRFFMREEKIMAALELARLLILNSAFPHFNFKEGYLRD